MDGGAGRDVGIVDARDRIVRVEFKGTMVRVKVRGRTILRLRVTKIATKRTTKRATRHVIRAGRRA